MTAAASRSSATPRPATSGSTALTRRRAPSWRKRPTSSRSSSAWGAPSARTPSPAAAVAAPCDAQLAHSGCCGGGERTRGHYQIARLMAAFLGAVGPGLTLEERGLSEAQPGLRPGDIVTTAAQANRYAALDVTVVSQRSARAGGDCLAVAFHDKLRKYASTIAEWRHTDRVFIPLCWSHEGRAHSGVARVQKYASQLMARRPGAGPWKSILRRWQADVGVALADRRARAAQACLPRPDPRHLYAMRGEARTEVAEAGEGGGDDPRDFQFSDEEEEAPPSEPATPRWDVASGDDLGSPPRPPAGLRSSGGRGGLTPRQAPGLDGPRRGEPRRRGPGD